MSEEFSNRAREKQYLADGVYAAWDGHSLVLTTEDGISVPNTIYINEEVWSALVDYIDHLKEKAKP